ncbi:MAG: hypothetical protein KBD76_00100 [Bacteriovorax sp.]|jgi:hypothetical protein|nr:hypothetical protein [Bacteriovorax sp.]
MAQYFFEAANEGQLIKAISKLQLIDSNIEIKQKKELTPFESDLSVIIELDANYEEVLSRLSDIKNLDRPLETIRPLQ